MQWNVQRSAGMEDMQCSEMCIEMCIMHIFKFQQPQPDMGGGLGAVKQSLQANPMTSNALSGIYQSEKLVVCVFVNIQA